MCRPCLRPGPRLLEQLVFPVIVLVDLLDLRALYLRGSLPLLVAKRPTRRVVLGLVLTILLEHILAIRTTRTVRVAFLLVSRISTSHHLPLLRLTLVDHQSPLLR